MYTFKKNMKQTLVKLCKKLVEKETSFIAIILNARHKASFSFSFYVPRLPISFRKSLLAAALSALTLRSFSRFSLFRSTAMGKSIESEGILRFSRPPAGASSNFIIYIETRKLDG